MSLIHCKECEAEVSNKANNCIKCGAPIKKKTSKLTWTVVVIIALIAIGNMLSKEPSTNTNLSSHKSKMENWNYSSNQDSITGKTAFYASVISNNIVNFNFPYNGTQHATLTLRTHPQYGKNILFKIEKGQFLCSPTTTCKVTVRFDDSKPLKFKASESQDRSTTVLFIKNHSSFVKRMMKAKKVQIQATFYQEGDRVFKFDVSNFDINKI